jgi:membrane fusion protein, macrolide-specific efflux system
MKRFLATALILMVIIPVIAGCSSGVTLSSDEVQVVTAVRGDIAQEITPSGNLVMPNVAKLNFGSVGTVTEVDCEIGDKVKTGQVLAKIDTLALEQTFIQSQVAYKQAQKTLELARAAANASGSVTSAPDPLTIEINTLAVEQARLRMVQAKDDLDNATIKAPFDGLIGQVSINVNDTASATQTVIRLVDPTRIQVNAYVNEMDVFSVKLGDSATISIDALASSTRMPATVFAISPSTDASSGVVNYLVKLNVKVPSNFFTTNATDSSVSSITSASSFKEGLTASVSIIIAERKGVIIIPNRAVTREGRDSIVNIVKEDGSLEKRVVQTGITSSQNVEITSGVKEGERIAIFRSSTAPTQQQLRVPRL